MRPIVVLSASLALAACVPQPKPEPSPVPPPTPAARPAPAPLAADWRDRPLTAGTWRYRQDPRGSLALFGSPGSDAALTLRCDRAAHQLYLSRAGAIAAPLTIRTTSMTRTVPVQPTGGTSDYVAAALTPGDPLLDAMGFSRGRFAVEQAGTPSLAIPAWAEIERVTEDCRG